MRAHGNMQNLPEAILAEIFGCIVDVDCFIRCSTVCKCWARALQSCRPKCLIVPSFQHERWEVDAAISTIKWLHLWQQQGSLQKEQQLVLDKSLLDSQYRRGIPQSPLARAVMTATSCSDLQICILRGCFCLTTAIALLPASLLVLDLWTESPSTGTLLSHFTKFRATLQSLKLRCEARNPDEFIDPCLLALMLDSSFCSLTTLEISNFFYSRLLPDSTLGDGLMDLRKCITNLEPDKLGIQLAQALIEQPLMEDLEIELFNAMMNSACVSKLMVPAASCLICLQVVGPKIAPSVLTDLVQVKFAYEFCRVQVHIR